MANNNIANNSNIISVTSDHVDPTQLTLGPAGTGQNPLDVFVLSGQPNVDPLQAASNVIMNEHTALGLSAFYSGVRFIAETIARFPKHVVKVAGGTTEPVHDHPLEWVLNEEINDLQTPYVCFSTFVGHAVVWSNAYLGIKPTQEGPQLVNVMPDRMVPFRFGDADRNIPMQQWFAYDTGEVDQRRNKPKYEIFSDSEIIHLPAFSFDGMAGLKMVKLMQSSLGGARDTEMYVNKYHNQGGMILGAIETDQKLTKEQALEIEERLKNKFSGLNNSNKWIALGNGAKANMLNPTLDSDKLLAARQWSVAETCRMLRVPPSVLYDYGRATWSNAEDMGVQVVVYTLANWVRPIEQELSRKLLTRAERKSGLRVKLDASELLRADRVALTNNIVKLVSNATMTPDEGRAELGLKAYPDGIGAAPRTSAATVELGTVDEDAAATVEVADLRKAAKPKGEELRVAQPAKPALLPDFAELFRAAATRVENKTTKATDNAVKTKKDWTVWGNVFAEEQRGYVMEAITPILQTFSRINPDVATPPAGRIGDAYAAGLRAVYAARVHGEQGTPLPDLMAIITKELTHDDN